MSLNYWEIMIQAFLSVDNVFHNVGIHHYLFFSQPTSSNFILPQIIKYIIHVSFDSIITIILLFACMAIFIIFSFCAFFAALFTAWSLPTTLLLLFYFFLLVNHLFIVSTAKIPLDITHSGNFDRRPIFLLQIILPLHLEPIINS